jgi:hypothetical protein
MKFRFTSYKQGATTMNLKIFHIKLSNETQADKDANNEILVEGKPESLLVSVCERNDTPEGNLDVSFEVEIRNFRNMTIDEIESLAVKRALTLL